MALANSSLPVPLSPSINTLESVFAARFAISFEYFVFGESPMILEKE